MTQIALDPTNSLLPQAAPSSTLPPDDAFANRLASVTDEQSRPAAAPISKSNDRQKTTGQQESPPSEQEPATAAADGQDTSGQADNEFDEQAVDANGEPLAATPPVAEAAAEQIATDLIAEDQLVLSEEAAAIENRAVQTKGEGPQEQPSESAPQTSQTQPIDLSQRQDDPLTTALSLPANEATNTQAEAQTTPPQDAAEGAVPDKPARQSVPASSQPDDQSEQEIAKQPASPIAVAASAEAKPASPESSGKVAERTPGLVNDNAARQDAPDGEEHPGERQASSNHSNQNPAAQQAEETLIGRLAEQSPEEAEPREPIEPPSSARPESKADSTRPDAPRALDRLAAGKITNARPAEQASLSPADRVDAARFVGRVSKAFEAASQRGDVVRLRLSPPELGAMQIRLSIGAEGAMSASVETETSAARSVLLDNLPALRERLADIDINVEKFDVDVRREGAGEQYDWKPDSQDRQSQSKQRQAGTVSGSDSNPTPETDTQAVRSLAVGGDQINLII